MDLLIIIIRYTLWSESRQAVVLRSPLGTGTEGKGPRKGSLIISKVKEPKASSPSNAG